MEVDQQHLSGLPTLADGKGVGDEGATEGGWEVELASQRDVSNHSCQSPSSVSIIEVHHRVL